MTISSTSVSEEMDGSGTLTAADAPGALQSGSMADSYHGPVKGKLKIVHLYPREMSIYGDFGNVRALQVRAQRHGYEVEVLAHHPGTVLRDDVDIIVGGGGQDSGQARVEDDLAANGDMLRHLAADKAPMLVVCGMYQLLGRDFTTVAGKRLPGLGILDVTTTGAETRMVGPVVISGKFGEMVGYENHSGRTLRGPEQAALGTVLYGQGNDGQDGTEGAVKDNVYGTYLHGPVLPSNPAFTDELLRAAVERQDKGGFEPEALDDTLADEARHRQVERLLAGYDDGGSSVLPSVRDVARAALRRARAMRR
ncbi:type 1 glutamine amidotransferase [Dermatophilus congolensis]|nr:cobalamin biosynthesis protein CobB [Dermatophilus congolensis]